MMFPLNRDKAIQSLLYVVHRLKKADKHKTYKILYFADQKHLVRYGRPIIGDTYMKMSFGPVPSFVKNIVDEEIEGLEELVAVYNKYHIKALEKENLDFLSVSDVACLQEAIDENKDLEFGELTEKSHKDAWKKASWQMDYIQIAKEAGCNDDMLKFIKANMENSKIDLM